MSHAIRTAVAVIAAATVGALAVPGTASALKPVEREHYPIAYGPAQEEICGVTATLTATGSGVFSARPVKGSDGTAFFGHDNFYVVETWTTAAGEVVIERNASIVEQRATKVPGTVTYDPDGPAGPLAPVTTDDVWLFAFKDSGTFEVFVDGERVLRATGVFKGQEQFDTLGDDVPGGSPVPGTFEVLKDQTGQSFTEEEFCEVVVAELT